MPHPPPPPPIALILRSRRMTNRELSRLAGYSETWISLVVNGRERPSPRLSARLAEVLGVPEADLFGDLREEEPDAA